MTLSAEDLRQAFDRVWNFPDNVSDEVAQEIRKQEMDLEPAAIGDALATMPPMEAITLEEAFALGVTVGVRAERDKRKNTEIATPR